MTFQNNQEYNLSFVVTTRNKLPLLREVVNRLINNVKADEEIIVIDADSTDGTKEYLQELFNSGKIHQYLSEPDKGEAHGFNKGFLKARGKLIKVITDDDDFYWQGIQECKEFMLSHPEIDVLGTDGGGTTWPKISSILPQVHYNIYQKWKLQSIPFWFCGLGLMIRRSSLPLTGLFHTGLVRVDAEFSLRITSIPVNLAWYTGFNYVRITNSQSNTITQNKRIILEGKKLTQFYLEGKYKKAESLWIKLKNFIYSIKPKCKTNSIKNYSQSENWSDVFAMCDKWLEENNNKVKKEFIFK